MTKLKIRKIVLLALDVILLLVCIIQVILGNRDTTRTFKLTEAPDEIYIYNQGNEVNLVFHGDKWYVGQTKDEANQTYVESLIKSFSTIRAIDKVGSVKNEVYIEKYQLDESKCISVIAKKNGEIIRSVQLGKNGADQRQTYGTVDGSTDIYLLSGSLRGIFNLNEESLKDKTTSSETDGDVSPELIQQFLGNIEDVETYSASKDE